MRRIWRSGIYLRWCKTDCLSFFFELPLFCKQVIFCSAFIALSLVKRHKADLGTSGEKKLGYIALFWCIWVGASETPALDVSLCLLDVLQPYLHPGQVGSPRQWVAGGSCCHCFIAVPVGRALWSSGSSHWGFGKVMLHWLPFASILQQKHEPDPGVCSQAILLPALRNTELTSPLGGKTWVVLVFPKSFEPTWLLVSLLFSSEYTHKYLERREHHTFWNH